MINSENAIEVRNVTKYFKSYEDKAHRLRERIVNIGRNKYEKRLILDDISFDVKKGEAIGLIGKNGCGKSTTLKMLTKILKPNSGTIEMAGRVSSLIELGAGFHPDLTGRENIYINASIFGIKAKEVDKRLDDIIRFSELEEYIDNPVRTYSSGMYMRLAFAVAINVEADILLIDEILAVGDQAFQTKCFNKLKSLKDDGVTIVLVSHSIDQVQKICDRAVWIEKGKIRSDGPVKGVCKEYLEEMEANRKKRAELEALSVRKKEEEKIAGIEDEAERKDAEEKYNKYLSCRDICAQCGPDARRDGTGEVRFTNVSLVDDSGEKRLEFVCGDKIDIVMEYEAEDNFIDKDLDFVIGITKSDWTYIYGTKIIETRGTYVKAKKKGKVIFTIDGLNILPATYFLDVRIRNTKDENIDNIYSLIEFKVVDYKNSEDVERGLISLAHSWKEE